MRRLYSLLAVFAATALVAAVVLAALVGIQYRRNDRPIVLPKPRGPHAVGRSVFAWTDAVRSRELMVFVWYPAAAGTGGPRAAYIPGRWGSVAARGHVPIPARRMETIEVSAVEDAAGATGRYPILVLLPGMGLAPAHYTTLAEDLASHGFIVAGVAPTGSTRDIVFPGGRVAEGDEDPDLNNADVDRRVVRTWRDDAGFAVDQVLATPRLAPIADAARVGVVGHSFGGAVAMQLLKNDARFKAAANLDGAPWGDRLGTLDRPLLVLTGGSAPALFGSAGDAHELRAICRASRAACEVREFEQAGHADFSDEAVLPSRFPFPNVLIGRGHVDGVQFQREVADRLSAFFLRSL